MRAKREGVSSLFPPRSSLLAPRSSLFALFFSLLALPSSLLALDGLTFNGGQWIETGYCPTAGDRFECVVTVNATQPNASAAVFGTVREQEPERTFAFYVRQGGDDSSVVAYGDMARGGFFPRGKRVSLSVGPDGATWTWDGGSDRLSLTPGFARDGVTPLLIGDVNAARYMDASVPAGTGAAMTLHRFRIWRGGLELVHDYVPRRSPSGEIGLYDTLEKAEKTPFKRLEPVSSWLRVPYRTWDPARLKMVDCVCTNPILVTASLAILEDGQWYAVTGTVSCSTISVNGAAHLILCNGTQLTAGAITNGALAVYGQPSGCGELTVSGSVATALTVQGGRTSAGALSGDSLAVVGGTVTADDVRSGMVMIAGGSVKAGQTTFVSDNFGQTTFVNRAGQPLHCVNVKVEKLKVERLTVEGLGNYGTNDIYPIDGRVYLWLPDGTHRFAVSDDATTNRYCAVVNGMDITVEPLGPVGFFVNGEDVGEKGSGDGWTYQEKVLTLDNAKAYVLSGEAANDEVQVKVAQTGATVVLSNAVVYASGRPALDVAQNAALQMAGGASYLAATNNAAAVTVAKKAELKVGYETAAIGLEAMIGVFNFGSAAAIGGEGAVTVEDGTFFVWSDDRAVGLPNFEFAPNEAMQAGDTPEEMRYTTMTGWQSKRCVLVAPGVNITVLSAIPHVSGITVSNEVQAIEGMNLPSFGTVYHAFVGDNVFIGYTVETGYTSKSANPLVYAAVDGDIVVDANVIPTLPNIPYRAWNDATGRMVDCVCSNYTVVTADTTAFEDGQWYAVTGTVSCGSIAVSGAAHLILCDDATLTAGAITNGALAVYGQPSGCGVLDVSGTVAAALTVQGGRTSAGTLSGDSLAVVGGTVTADDVRGGKATIDGGSVKAGQTTFVSDNFGQTDFVNRAGQPLHCVNVKVEKLKVERLKVEGLGNYGTNDIYPIDGRVYLWLPDGTHRFAVSDGARTNRYCAVVNGMDITVEPLGPVGFFVNGEDVGDTGSGTGWVYMGKNLTLNGVGPYVLSGEAANDEVHIHVISPNAATVILSNAVVFVSGLLPALNVDQNASFLMTGGASYLAATNDAAAVSVGPSAALTVGLAPGADEAESMICVFNYGDRAAVDGAGAVAVNGGTLAVWADRMASAVPLTRAADVFCMVAGSNPETAKVVDTYNGEAYVLVTASVAPVTPGRPVGPFATAEAATNVQAIAFVEPSAPVSEVLTSGALRKTYCDMFALGVTGGDESWFVEAALTPAARTNLAETANGATRQIPVAAIARLKPDVTTNVTVNGCAPGFYYSLRGSGSLEGLGGLEGSGGVESFAVYGPKLCGADAKVVFPKVKKPSEPAGFFKVGVDVTDGVGK